MAASFACPQDASVLELGDVHPFGWLLICPLMVKAERGSSQGFSVPPAGLWDPPFSPGGGRGPACLLGQDLAPLTREEVFSWWASWWSGGTGTVRRTHVKISLVQVLENIGMNLKHRAFQSDYFGTFLDNCIP